MRVKRLIGAINNLSIFILKMNECILTKKYGFGWHNIDLIPTLVQEKDYYFFGQGPL